MDNLLDLTEIDEDLADDIRELYEYDKTMTDEFAPLPDIDFSELCFKIIKHRSWEAEDLLEDTYNDLSKLIFEEMDYDFDKAEEIYHKLWDWDDNSKTFIKVLIEFDNLSRDFAEKEIYPMILVNSLSIIYAKSTITSNIEVMKATWYVVSHYKSFALAYICQKHIEGEDTETFVKMGFRRPLEEERKLFKELVEKYLGSHE